MNKKPEVSPEVTILKEILKDIETDMSINRSEGKRLEHQYEGLAVARNIVEKALAIASRKSKETTNE